MKICFVLIYVLAGYVLEAQVPEFKKGAVVYLVRHAEKADGKDPVLTPAGEARAKELALRLKKSKLGRIYVSQFKRTQLTALPLQEAMGVDTVQYWADTTGAGLWHLVTEKGDNGKVILIVGHSNTIPALIRQLGVGSFTPKELPDNEFDRLYQITFTKRRPRLKVFQYGAPTPVSVGVTSMQPLQ